MTDILNYADRLHQAVTAKQTPALIGLDPRFNLLPADVIASARKRQPDETATVAAAFEEFCCRLIDVVAPLVPAVKPQAAFFEEWGPAGCQALAKVIHYARQQGLIVICDAKRGDIGSTAEAYARGYLAGSDPKAAVWGADALTVSPYLGRDTLEPFVNVAKERGAGIYVLVRTSNPGAGTFQDRQSKLKPGSETMVPHYRHIARAVEELAAETADGGQYGIVGGVVGATYPDELAELRAAMPHVPLLVPGYGSQGGTAADVAAGFSPDGLGALVNSSRGINFAFRSEPFASQFGEDNWEQAAEAATKQMIADLAEHTPAGALR
ncbi:MAG: orotidine-5'-phosphate decarboxylase [Planctomycetaceae bacterium]|jgi:orotidine-5'-phosphate decarboxylase|nr:orotidine-5'-phosphate decarboxylase [Planctomycetaceae bacterium]MBT6157970.1 orotidine-5'-phosphate decarboxylase [Planctomycetaceae bacterium]MBT6487393.1 orotidine-5'-phosphate decarboxylase [Planctomycetaceae bacterium]MBT6496898.1 orotidine-5'-phosphate decarboxylase [Planctomycetaceae bacterium]